LYDLARKVNLWDAYQWHAPFAKKTGAPIDALGYIIEIKWFAMCIANIFILAQKYTALGFPAAAPGLLRG
jgi:hypothetical protein